MNVVISFKMSGLEINKEKRFKEYVRRGIITGIEIESDKANQSVVYNIL